MSLQGDYRNPTFVESATFCRLIKQEMSKVDTTTTLATQALKRKSDGEELKETLSRKSIKIIDSSKLESLLEGAKKLEEEIHALKQVSQKNPSYESLMAVFQKECQLYLLTKNLHVEQQSIARIFLESWPQKDDSETAFKQTVVELAENQQRAEINPVLQAARKLLESHGDQFLEAFIKSELPDELKVRVQLTAATICPEALADISKFNITDRKVIIEVALNLIRKDFTKFKVVLDQLAITDKKEIRECIASLISRGHSSGLCAHVDALGLKSEAERFELALTLANHSDSNISEHIRKFNITDPQKLLKIAAAAAKTDKNFAANFKNYGAMEWKDRFNLAKLAIDKNCEATTLHLDNFDLAKDLPVDRNWDQSMAELLGVAFEAYPSREFFSMIDKFNFNEESREAIALGMASSSYSSALVDNFAKFNITDPAKRLWIIEELAKTRGLNRGDIQKLGIEGSEQKLKLAQLAAENSTISEHLQEFDIKEEEERLNIALKAVKHNPANVITNLSNYHLNQENQFQVVLAASKVDGKETIEALKIFKIKDLTEEQQYQLALCVARSSPQFLSANSADLFSIANQSHRHAIAREALLAYQDELKQKRPENMWGWAKDFYSSPLLASCDPQFCFEVCKELGFDVQNLSAFKSLITSTPNKQIAENLASWILTLVNTAKLRDADPDLFTSPQALKCMTLMVNYPDSDRRLAISEKLLDLYVPGREEQKKLWLNMVSPNLPDHLLLTTLLLPRPGLDAEQMQKLIRSMSSKSFSDMDTIMPFNELLVRMISWNESVNQQFFQTLTGMKQSEFKKMVASSLNLICFGMDRELGELKDYKSVDKKIDAYIEKLMSGSYGLNGKEFLDFTKQPGIRNVSAFTTYASRLELLPGAQKDAARAYYGLVLRSIIAKKLQDIRYETAKSPHLQLMEEKQPGLLAKWMIGEKPIKAKDLMPSITGISKEVSGGDARSSVLRCFQEALIKNRMLGGDHFSRDFASLAVCLNEPSNHELIERNLAQLQEKFQEISVRIKEAKTDKAMLQSEKSRIIIQMQCLKLLNSRTDVKEFKKTLEEFPARLGDYPPFKAEISKLFQEIYRVQTPKDGWMVKDTDDWQDLHLCGTELQGSCLNVSSHEVVNNKCVLGVLLDGKIRMIAVSDEKGVLKARCFARPLWVEEKGKFVYNIERIYLGDKDPDLPALVKQMCLRRAEALGLEPVVSGFCVKMDKWQVEGPYSGEAESKGSRCEWEYVDSAGGASAGPVYKIDDLYRVSKNQ